MDKLRKRLYQVSEGLELIIALVAVVGVVIAAVNLFPELLVYWQNRTNGEAFLIFLDAVFDVVIGVEFIKMLLQTKFTEYHGGFDLSDCPSYDRTENVSIRRPVIRSQHRNFILFPQIHARNQTG